MFIVNSFFSTFNILQFCNVLKQACSAIYVIWAALGNIGLHVDNLKFKTQNKQ